MIARIWRGATAKEDARSYVEYLRQTGLREYRETPGNQAAWILWREDGDRAEFLTVSLWESEAAIVGFAGEDIQRAVFYPEDDRYVVERDLSVTHFHVVSADQPRAEREIGGTPSDGERTSHSDVG